MNFSINTNVTPSIVIDIFSTTYFPAEVLASFEQLEALEKENIVKLIKNELSAGDGYRLEEKLAAVLKMDVNTVFQICNAAQDAYMENKAYHKAGGAKIFSSKYFTTEVLEALNKIEMSERIKLANWFNLRLSTGDAYRLLERVSVALNLDVNSTNHVLLVARDAYLARSSN